MRSAGAVFGGSAEGERRWNGPARSPAEGGRAGPLAGQLVVSAVSSTTKLVWREESSLIVNFTVTLWPR